eukprot:2285138-Pleurochrysis_carterae.AAC.1
MASDVHRFLRFFSRTRLYAYSSGPCCRVLLPTYTSCLLQPVHTLLYGSAFSHCAYVYVRSRAR